MDSSLIWILDEDHFFTPETELWLEQTFQDICVEVGKINNPQAEEFIQQTPVRRYSVPLWYRKMVLRGREFVNQNGQDSLSFVKLPDSGKEWRQEYATAEYRRQVMGEDFETQVEQHINQELCNEWDTGELDEMIGEEVDLFDEEDEGSDDGVTFSGRYAPAFEGFGVYATDA